MKNPMIFVMVVLFGITAHYPAFAQDKPVLVFSTIALNINFSAMLNINLQQDGQGIFIPEIAVNSDGSWRKATLEDVEAGQKYRVKNPGSQGRVTVNSLKGDYYAGCNPPNNFKQSGFYWGVYRAKQPFRNVSHDEVITPKYVLGERAYKALTDYPEMELEKRLQNAVNDDWDNIQNQFPELQTAYISDFMVGDINGDGKDDYVLLLGYLQQINGQALFIYLSGAGNFSMIPVFYLETEDQYLNPFTLHMIMDFNGDGTKEFMVLIREGGTGYPIIYGWNKDTQGLMTLYRGDELFY